MTRTCTSGLACAFVYAAAARAGQLEGERERRARDAQDQRALAEVRARSEAEAYDNEREAARLKAYVQRAIYAIERARDSLEIFGQTAGTFDSTARERLAELYAGSRDSPTNAEIGEALAPVVYRYLQRMARFDRDARAVLGSVMDSLRLTGAARDQFGEAAASRLIELGDRDLLASRAAMQAELEDLANVMQVSAAPDTASDSAPSAPSMRRSVVAKRPSAPLPRRGWPTLAEDLAEVERFIAQQEAKRQRKP